MTDSPTIERKTARRHRAKSGPGLYVTDLELIKILGLPEDQGTELMADLLGPYRAFVETTKADQKKRGKPIAMIASYCPFCGSKYPERKSIFDSASRELTT